MQQQGYILSLHSYRHITSQAVSSRDIGCKWLRSLVLALGPFEELEQPVQALMQTLMKRQVMKTKQDGFSSFVLSTIKSVPLLHGQDYGLLLQLAIHAGTVSAGISVSVDRLPHVQLVLWLHKLTLSVTAPCQLAKRTD